MISLTHVSSSETERDMSPAKHLRYPHTISATVFEADEPANQDFLAILAERAT